MKILIVVHKLKKSGGAVLQISKIAKQLKHKGNKVVIFSFDNFNQKKNHVYRYIIAMKSLKKLIVNFSPDVIFTADPFFTTIPVLVVNKKKIPVVLRIGAVFDEFYSARMMEKIFGYVYVYPFYNILKTILRVIARLIFRNVSLVVFNCHFLKNLYRSQAPNSIVIHNGVEPLHISINSKNTSTLNLLYLGRIEPRKSVETAIGTIHFLRKKSICCTLSIIGDYNKDINYYKFLQKLILKYNLSDKIKFYGEIKHEDLPNILNTHDILLFTTTNQNFPITEGFPNVIIDAMANGLIVIASSVAGVTEILTSSEEIVNNPNYVNFAKNILNIYKNPGKMKEIKKNNIKKITECFNLDKATEKYLYVFKQIKKI